ncbi:MAG: Fic family protein [Nitrospirota bacterium]
MTDGRYDVSGLPEAQFEPGSGDTVLKNLVGITSKQAMDDAEAKALERATEWAIGTFDVTHRFTASDVCGMHRVWLGEIYEWAGRYRRVNVSKGEVLFAVAAQIPALMAEFEQGPLRRHTPCNVTGRSAVARALAEVHTELVLIHPFREGNGRVTRLLSTLMALQAGLPLLDFQVIAGEKKGAYFEAVRAGLDRDYEPMARIFGEIIERSGAAS